MVKAKLRQCMEGLIITAAGVVFTVLSANIRNNPVSVEGALNIIVQAKFIPLLISLLIVLQGIGLTISQWKGKERTTSDGGFTARGLTVVLLTVAYLIIVFYVGFTIPTVIYIGALLFIANDGRNPLQLLLLTALYSVIALAVIPSVLNLPMM